MTNIWSDPPGEPRNLKVPRKYCSVELVLTCFENQAHWAQTFKPLRLFLYPSYQPLINDQRIIVWCRRPQEFWLSWESRNWENFQVCQKAKGKFTHVVVGEPLKKSSDISHVWIAIRRNRGRAGERRWEGPKVQSGQAFLHHTQNLDGRARSVFLKS